MAEFDEKLNSLLSNPDAMAQIMQLAQSLGGNSSQEAAPPPQASAPSPSHGTNPSAAPPLFGGQRPPQGQQPFSGQTVPPPPAGGDMFSSLSSLAGGLDPKLLMKLLPVIQELGSQQDSNARQLLYALRPYLNAERQEKVERALQLARLFHLGRKFLTGREG